MEIAIVKIGGRVASEKTKTEALLRDMATVSSVSYILVHGGGAEVTSAAARFGIESRFVNGIRFTSPEEMAVVDAVLAGKINKELVRMAARAGLNGVGLSGSDAKLFTGRAVSDGSCTGTVTATDTGLLKLLLENGCFPIIATTSMTDTGLPLNINADEAALALASALKAARLIYISDIPGVLKEGTVIPRLDRKTVAAEIESGVISGGMIPKVNSSVEAVANGVGSVIIGGYEEEGDLHRLESGTKGTSITFSD